MKYQAGNIIKVAFDFGLTNNARQAHYAVIVEVEGGLFSVLPILPKNYSSRMQEWPVSLKYGLNTVLAVQSQLLVEQTKFWVGQLEAIQDDIESGTYEKPLPDEWAIYDIMEHHAQACRAKAGGFIETPEFLDADAYYKNGSIVLLGRISEITKDRILNPISESDCMFNLSLPDSDMKIINSEIAGLIKVK